MIPDILGYKLDDALSLLESSGFDISVVITKPTRGTPDGDQRVVKVDIERTSVVITVACEEKGKGGVHSGL